MKKFLFYVFLFLVPAYGLLAVIDYFYSQEVMKTNDRRIEAWYDLMHGNIDSDILIMGSSRVWVHISPMILDSVLHTSTYNIGIDGSGIRRQIHKYNMFIKYNRKPKVIIQNIDQWSFKDKEGYEKEQFFPYFWNIDMRNEMFSSEPFSNMEKYCPLYRYWNKFDTGMLFSGFFKKQPRYLYKGYRGMERPWNGKKYNEIKTIRFEKNDTVVMLFDNYLAQAKKDGIKVVFVYTPCYYGALNKTENIDEMHAFYKRIADKYNIPILDYMNMEMCKDTTYFYNAMHLNRQGAEIFSDSLAHDLKRMYYASTE